MSAPLNMNDTIVALSTPQGVGAISMIRLSGKDAIQMVNKLFNGKDLASQPSHTIHFGHLKDDDEVIDEVLVSIFHEPRSFTGENVMEISCHGSPYPAHHTVTDQTRGSPGHRRRIYQAGFHAWPVRPGPGGGSG